MDLVSRREPVQARANGNKILSSDNHHPGRSVHPDHLGTGFEQSGAVHPRPASRVEHEASLGQQRGEQWETARDAGTVRLPIAELSGVTVVRCDRLAMRIVRHARLSQTTSGSHLARFSQRAITNSRSESRFR